MDKQMFRGILMSETALKQNMLELIYNQAAGTLSNRRLTAQHNNESVLFNRILSFLFWLVPSVLVPRIKEYGYEQLFFNFDWNGPVENQKIYFSFERANGFGMVITKEKDNSFSCSFHS